MTTIHDTYLQGKVLSADPLHLVTILYSVAAQNTQLALETLDPDDAVARARAVAKVSDALGILTSALDLEAGGAVGQNLISLYLYMQRRLTESLAARSKSGFEEVHQLLTTLQSAWTELAARPASAMRPVAQAS